MRKLDDNKLRDRIDQTIDDIKLAATPAELVKAEKLECYSTAYKIRLGNYRMGIFIEGGTVIFSRFLPRKDIYKKFPPK